MEHSNANAKRISISILVISLPFLYLSLLRVPPSNLLKDTTFWFLMSNSIILIIVTTDSGILTSSGEPGSDRLYDEYVKSTRANLVSCRPEEVKYIDRESKRADLSLQHLGHDQVVLDRHVDRSRSEVAFKNRDVARKKLVRRSGTEKRICRVEESSRSIDHQYWKMSNEELNKRVEEFIRKFNREIRLQA